MPWDLQQGDRVCVLTNPCVDFAISLFATVSLGGIWLGLNPKYKARELEYILEDSDPNLILIEQSLKDSDAALLLKEMAETTRHSFVCSWPSLKR